MKKIAPQAMLLSILLSVAGVCEAATMYVTDDLEIDMRSGESNRHKILKMIPSGAALSVLSENPETGYTLVRTPSGQEGWVLSRYLSPQPAARLLLDKANGDLQAIKEENKQFRRELDALKGTHSETASENQILAQERDQLSRELRDLRETSANALQIKAQRDQLQERVVIVERELHQVKREKQTLEDSTNQDWFLYGGILAFIGIFLGLVIPRISWRRKSRWGDTF